MIQNILPKILMLSALGITTPLVADDLVQLPNQLNAMDNKSGAFISSKEGLFSIQLPEGFVETEIEMQPIQTEMGEIETVNYTSFSETAAAMIGTSTYPEALLVFIKGKERDVLEGAQEGALKNVSGTVVSEKSLDISSNPAKSVEFTAEADDQPLYGRALFILSGNRLYHVLFITSNKEEVNSIQTNAFFDSFKFEK